ncbi:MAG TPA: hypothetical protein VG319_10795 [Polyangia bacterium]|nr:hypothetical protein [Polyangia bacterium]
MRSRRMTLPRGRPSAATAAAFIALIAIVAPACNSEKPGAVKLCCDQPRIPPGVPAFAVVIDEVTGPTDGQDVKMRVAFKQKTKRDDVYPALHFLYRYAMTRNTFEPINFVGELYATEGGAQTGGNPIAKVWRDRESKGPKCENSVPLEFPEEVQRAFDSSLNRAEVEDLADTCHLDEKKKVARIDEGFKHKPTFTVDAANRSTTVTYPYLEPGKDEYVHALSFNAAMTYWAEFMTAMFSKSAELKQLTYVGVLDEEPVLKITVTRQQFDEKLSRVQETISSYAAITFAKLGLHKTDDKGAKKDQEQQKTKTYKAALSFLPKDAAFVSPKLKLN